ncbi:MAG: VCBS repeat-containing protein [Candidatus Hydrogenedentes bacterium]|nr:VCBS repeat-containing protein [Candidatus Hydrogenedentota bacterium]
MRTVTAIFVAGLLPAVMATAQESKLVKLAYQHPGLVVDLGVGLWAQPLPMDFDQDGDLDLVVATADVPSNGVYFFENPGGGAMPVFKPGKRLGDAVHNMTVSYLEQGPLVISPGNRHPDFVSKALAAPQPLNFKPPYHEGRDKQYKLYDYDGDGLLDLAGGISDWREYGWDNAYNGQGEWTRGPLHAFVYIMRNTGSNDQPDYAEPVQVQAGGATLDVYGAPSPNFADFDGDGDHDLLCGEFLDRFSYFENTGSRTEPVFAAGRFLTRNGDAIKMDLEMLQVVALDWDGDRDVDLVVGQEDGRVAYLEHTGEIRDGVPVFTSPRFFQQEAEYLKVGALNTPFGIDWDADGDQDLLSGDTAGYLSFVENLDGGNPPQWAAPVYLKANGTTIRIQAGPNGSIQGPAEAKWGYTALGTGDWDGDGLNDIMINSIWGEALWYKNIGTAIRPELAAAQPVDVEFEGAVPKPAWVWWTPKGKQLVSQWRTSPVLHDLNQDGLLDLLLVDPEGYLALYERAERDGKRVVLPPQRIFLDETGAALRLSDGVAGKSGRRNIAIADWDQDGKLDLLICGKNIDFWRNIGEAAGVWQFKNEGMVDPRRLAGHTTCPAIVDWDGNQAPDLVIGAEDGFFYYLKNPNG